MTKVFVWIQDEGVMLDDAGNEVAEGWAGHGAGRNNPAMQPVHEVGPLPQGLYDVGPWGDASSVLGYPAHLGPFIARLTQVEGETFGRDGFYIHGPGGADPTQSSKGCVEIMRVQRLQVMAMRPDQLRVVGTRAQEVTP